MTENWKRTDDVWETWLRVDGAKIVYCPWSFKYVAFEPETRYQIKTANDQPRRWKTALLAMKGVDKLYPERKYDEQGTS